MNSKVLKNYIYNLSYQLLIIFLPIITTPYISRVLGASGIGDYNYTNSIVQYFILFGCIGLNLYGQREIAYYQNEDEKRSIVFYELLILRIITIFISLIIYFIFVKVYSKYMILFFIQAIDIIASMFDVSWLFQGMEDFKKTVIRNFIIRIIFVVFLFTCIKTRSDLNLYVFGCSLTIILGNLSLWFYLKDYVKKVNISVIQPFRHLSPAIALFVPQIAISLYAILDKTMIGILSGDTTEVAFYTQSQIIIRTVLTLITSLSTAMMPRIANLFVSDNNDEIQKFMYSSINFVLILGMPFTFGIIGIVSNLVPWYFGSEFLKVIPNMIIISPIIIAIGLTSVFGTQYLLSIKKQREYTISVFCGAITNLIFNLLLIPHFLSLGAAVATVLAETMVLAVQVYFVRKDFNLGIIVKGGLKYCFYSMIMGFFVYEVSTLLSISLLNTFIEILIGGIIYFLILILTKDTYFIGMLSFVLKRKS